MINATTHATRAKIAERRSPFAMKNANGSTRSRRTAVSALAIEFMTCSIDNHMTRSNDNHITPFMTLAEYPMPEMTIPYRVDAALERGIEGRGLSREDALSLMEEGPLEALLETAAAVRDRFKGRSVSYSKKVFIPLTHLCRDYCGYCTFRADPQAGVQAYMLPDEVLAVAEAGRRAGCKEALFSLGDQPERVFPEAKEFLKKLGFERTLEYLAAMSELVLEKTGLLPHSNPGVMGADDLRRLRETNVSVGLMLESASPRLLRVGGAHWKAPDKVPSLRIRTIENAGQLSMAFTTGHSDRNRRDAGGTRGRTAGDSFRQPEVRPHPGSNRATVPRQVGYSHGCRRRSLPPRTWSAPSRSPD